tara:strand:- start:122456 stop:123511 length:1056 start_codon:yes stop_codon:yes gene_type:complete
MSSKKHKLAVVIGRFQLFTQSHMSMIEEALDVADNVIVLVGSINRSQSLSNPFNYEERREMIRKSLRGDSLYRVEIKGVNDYMYVEYDWESEVQRVVHEHAQRLRITSNKDIVLVGHIKDNTSYYLRSFPTWDMHDVSLLNNGENATEHRNRYFKEGTVSDSLPSGTVGFLEEYKDGEGFEWMQGHIAGIEEFQAPYKDLPYGMTFQTGDALVINRGHILMVERGQHPGYGQWALPGGFKHPGEWARDCILRELEEETLIKVGPKALKGAYKGKRFFEGPGRDDRGDLSTHVGLFILDEDKLPKVKGADDAKKARWIPFAQYRRMSKVLFADHYFIIDQMLKSGYGTGFTL